MLPRLLTPIAAGLLAAWAATCVITGTPWGLLDVLVTDAAAFTPAVCIASVAVATAALRRGQRVSGILAVAAGLFPWFFVLGYAAPSDAPPPAGARTVVAMLVTARAGQADAAAVVQAVRTHQVDVLVMSELSLTLSHQLTTAGLDRLLTPRWFALPGHGDGEGGLGLWSRLPVGDVVAVPGTTWPTVSARVGGRFTLIAGHVRPPGPGQVDDWRRDLAALAAAADRARAGAPGTEVVLIGNLNATPWHPAFRALLAHHLADAADLLGRGLRPTWPGWSPVPLVPLDHVLLGGPTGVTEVDTLDLGTPHRALLVTLQV